MGTARYLAFFLAGTLAAATAPAPGLNHFAIGAYQQLDRGQDNLILSPFSISMALSMLLSGARGTTAAGIAAALDQPNPGAPDAATLSALTQQLTEPANLGGNQLLIANGLWAQAGFPIETDFRQTILNLYHAPLTPLDFAAHAEQARAEINSWTAQHTKGKIHDLFGPGALDAKTRLILTSAIYFNGKWQSQFRPDETRPDDFHTAAGGTAQARFMHQESANGYLETPKIQILEMKYAGTPLAFDILLPKTNDGLPALEKSLTADALATWLAELKNQTVTVTIPKFRAEAQFSLRSALSAMGMGDTFQASADFSGIDGHRDLVLSDVVHKAFVDVSEEGTEAAAATGGVVSMIAMRHPQHPVFRADHPFLFLIRDTHSGVILFEGRLTNPKG